MGNAIKFTDDGEVSVDVSCRPLRDGRVQIYFAVTDSGVGIPKEEIANIFSEFTQAESSTTRKYGGTGLGTAISKQIVELMGGNIGLHSMPGIGSTFWLEASFDKQPISEDMQPL